LEQSILIKVISKETICPRFTITIKHISICCILIIETIHILLINKIMLESMLGLEEETTIKDLAITFGCTGATDLATQVLQS
jgi:hypothetical protein